MRQALRAVYFNIALLCVLLVGLELAGQVVFRLARGYWLPQSPAHRESRIFEQHPYLVGRLRSGVRIEQNGIVVTTTAGNTRWTGASENNTKAIRVALLGGSTTFGTRVTDTASWAAHLQRLLGSDYEVTNYGMAGYSTAEAIVQMALIVPESRPDIVVLYEGWNDIRIYHQNTPGPDYYVQGMQQFGNLDLPSSSRVPLMARLADLSATCRLAVVLSKMLKSGARPDSSQGRRGFSTPDPFVDRIYRRNLGTLRLLVRQAGAYAIFVPQVMNDSWFQQHPGSESWTPGIDNRAMPELIHRFAGIMNNVCGAETDCSVLNEASSRTWAPEDFVDNGHFSGSGGEAFARLIAERIRKVPRRQSPPDSGG